MFAIAPAIVLGFGGYYTGRANFYRALFDGEIGDADFLRRLINASSVFHVDWNVLIFSIGVVLAIFSISFLLIKTDRHTNMGISSNQGLYKHIPASLYKTAFFVLLIWLSSELLNLIIIGLMYFVNNATVGVLRLVVLMVLNIGARFFMGFLMAKFSATLPVVTAERYKLNIAMSYSVRLLDKQHRMFTFGFASVYVFFRVMLILLCAVINNSIVSVVLCSIYYFCWLVVIVPLFFTKYLSASYGKRSDLTSKPGW